MQSPLTLTPEELYEFREQARARYDAAYERVLDLSKTSAQKALNEMLAASTELQKWDARVRLYEREKR